MRRGINQECRYGLTRSAGIFAIMLVTGSMPPAAQADGWDPTTKASNRDSIANTRHNLTMSYSFGRGDPSNPNPMDPWRNQYLEVCVYCHTPHGANTQIRAPLWNRTVNKGTYEIYEKNRTLNQPIGQPGPNSLTCLSCHDGTISIDSIINMPGSGGYSKLQEDSATVSTAFLDAWDNGGSQGHFVLGSDPYSYDPNATNPKAGQCVFCHDSGGGITGSAPDLSVFALGTDLRNDHPIGILFPFANALQPGVDFNKPNLIYTNAAGSGTMLVFDKDGNGYPDKGEPRMYETGDGYEVECASCHDPHGVPISGDGSEFIPSFLRVSNGNATTGEAPDGPSGLCLTCHLK